MEAAIHIEPLNSLIIRVGLSLARNRPRVISCLNVPIQLASSKSSASGIDVNNAIIGELTQLPGIGVTLAQRIVDFRDTHGLIDDLAILMRIKGISLKRFAQIHPRLSVSSP